MSPLNVRQTKFVQFLFEGHPAVKAYELAGYKPQQSNSSRMIWYDKIQAKLAELQAKAAKASEVTVKSLLSELEEARVKASNLDQLSAATTAIMGKAKLAGFLTDKIETKVNIHSDFSTDSNNSIEDIAAELAHNLSDGVVLTEQQRVEFGELLMSWVTEISEYLAAAKAKPINSRSAEIERRRLGLAPRQIGNGRA